VFNAQIPSLVMTEKPYSKMALLLFTHIFLAERTELPDPAFFTMDTGGKATGA
jgi:hypothetical protein